MTTEESTAFQPTPDHQHEFQADSDGNWDKCSCGEKRQHVHAWMTTDHTNRFGGVIKCMGRTIHDRGCTAVQTIYTDGFERWDGEWAVDSYKAPGVIETQDPLRYLGTVDA